MSSFQIIGLDPAPFSAWFDLPPDQLKARGAQMVRADEANAYPCRVSLRDAEIGETLLLLPWQHVAPPSPYQASGPIFVKNGAQAATLVVNEVPDYVSRRLISVRAYDANHIMVDAEVCAGSEVHTEIRRMLATANVRYLHLHNARRGCYSCKVVAV